MNREQVIALIKEHLKGLPFGVHVVEDGIRQDGDWWTVPVHADDEPQRRWRYYDILAGVESDISDEEDVNILLVPVS